MGSGVIYAVIIVMWAAYFIPRWLRRHEELSESRSVERFSDAMRILSRREPTPDRRYVVMPPRPDEASPGRSWRSRRSRRRRRGGARRPGPARLGRSRSAAGRGRALAVRRRRVLVALLVATLVATIATPFTALPWWGATALAGLLLLDVAHLRVQARRRRELGRSRQAVRRRTRARMQRFDSAERIVAARRDIAEDRAAADAARLAAADASAGSRDAARAAPGAGLAPDDGGWQPTPVPLPTYVSKPRAPRTARPVDPTVPGTWTGTTDRAEPLLTEEPFDQTSEDRATASPGAAEPAEPLRLDDDAGELDAIIERRRAVND